MTARLIGVVIFNHSIMPLCFQAHNTWFRLVCRYINYLLLQKNFERKGFFDFLEKFINRVTNNSYFYDNKAKSTNKANIMIAHLL